MNETTNAAAAAPGKFTAREASLLEKLGRLQDCPSATPGEVESAFRRQSEILRKALARWQAERVARAAVVYRVEWNSYATPDVVVGPDGQPRVFADRAEAEQVARTYTSGRVVAVR